MAYTVTFWGTRGSIPTPGAHTARYGGNTPCVAVEGSGGGKGGGGGQLVILDAGTGIRGLGRELVEGKNGAVPAPPTQHCRAPARTRRGRTEHGVRDRQRARAGRTLRDRCVVAQGLRGVPGGCGAAHPRRDVHA